MWTDGRYYSQIARQLYPGWKMMKIEKNEISLTDYIKKNLPKGKTIAMDYNLFTKSIKNTLFIFLDIAGSIIIKLYDYKFVHDDNNIIDVIWGSDKPKYKKDPILILPVEYTGKSCLDKYKEIKEKIDEEIQNELKKKKKKNFTKKRYLISKLDCLAWTLNLRGQDISYNPLFFSYGLLYFTENDYYFHLFSDKDKFNKPEIESYLKENKITLFDYNEIYTELLKTDENTLTIADQQSTNYKMYKLIFSKESNTISLQKNIIEHIKCIKNPVEISGYKKCNIRDCVALLKLFSWIEDELKVKKRTDLNEYEIGLQGKKFREEQELFMGESFAPICAAGPNAAIIHYDTK